MQRFGTPLVQFEPSIELLAAILIFPNVLNSLGQILAPLRTLARNCSKHVRSLEEGSQNVSDLQACKVIGSATKEQRVACQRSQFDAVIFFVQVVRTRARWQRAWRAGRHVSDIGTRRRWAESSGGNYK